MHVTWLDFIVHFPFAYNTILCYKHVFYAYHLNTDIFLAAACLLLSLRTALTI